MKLEELLEVNFQSVDSREPSGRGAPTTVDPDKFDAAGDNSEVDRSKRLRQKWKVSKDMRKLSGGGATVATDNVDRTGSGGNSVVNGAYK